MKKLMLKTHQQGGAQPVIVEKGEIARDINGNLVQIHPDAPSHDDGVLAHATGSRSAGARRGGVQTDMLESVLSDSQSQINAGDRASNPADTQIKIKPSEAKQIAGTIGLKIKPSSSMSPSKLFLSLQTARDKQAKKLTVKERDENSTGKIFQDSQRVNTIQQAALPDDHALYDLVFGIQESMKQVPVEEDTYQRGGIVNLNAVTVTGKRKPITVSNPNDPRLRAYKDSLALYNKGEQMKLADQKHAQEFKDMMGIEGALSHRTIPYSQAETFDKQSYPGKIHPVAFGAYGGARDYPDYPIYKKPTQPVIYKKPVPIQKIKYSVNQLPVEGINQPEFTLPGVQPVQYIPPVQPEFVPQGNYETNDQFTRRMHMQRGGKVKLSTQGYKRNSPDRNEPYLQIPGNSITMEGVDHDVMLYGDGGEIVHATPDNDYVLPNSSSVLEVPLAQQGGIPRLSPSETARMLLGKYPGMLDVPGMHVTPAELDASRNFEQLSDPDTYTDLTVYPGKKPTKAQVKHAQKKKLALKKSTPVIKQAKQAGVAKQSGIDYSKFLPDQNGDSTVPLTAPASYAPGVITQQSLNRAFTPETRDPAIVEGVDTVPTNLQQQIAQKYVDDVNPFKPKAYQFAGDLFNLMSASTRAPGYLQQLTPKQLHLERVNGTASTQALYNAYQNANQSIPDPSTQMGRAQGVAQYSAFLDSLNGLNGNLNGQNVQIANQEAQYNNQLNNSTEQTNANLRDQFYVRDLQTEEARRQQISSTINSVTSKLAQADQAAANYKLFKSTYAPRYKIGENGKIVLDKNNPDIQFGDGSASVNPNTVTTTQTTLDGSGNVKSQKITKKELDQLISNPSLIQRLRSQGVFSL